MLHTLLYFLALFSLSTASSWAKLNHMPVSVLGFWRLGIACLVISIYFFIFKKQKLPKIDKKIYWPLFSGFLFFLHLYTYTYAAKNTSIANTMILFASNPVWSSLGAILFFKDKISSRLITAYVLALTSIVILVFGKIEFKSDYFIGDLSAVVSAFLYAAYMLSSKKARQHYANSIFSIFLYGTCAAFFFLNGFAIFDNQFIDYDAISWIAVAGQVLIPTFLGHLTFTYLVSSMNISLMTCGKLLEPLMASIIAYYVFSETLSSFAWISFGLTALSVVILFYPTVKNLKFHWKNL